MEKINFICGGRTGDLIHNLLPVKLICENHNLKAIVYITNLTELGGDVFHYDIEKTYNDLKPFIMSQPYIDSFHIYNYGDTIKNCVNLNQFRWSKLLMKTNWVDLLCDNYQLDPPTNPWMTSDKLEELDETILIHRSTHRHTSYFPWEDIVTKNKCKFITNTDTKHEYDIFPYKDKVELLTYDSFNEMVQSINSCKLFIGNITFNINKFREYAS